jgi:hypothetical protein
MLCPKLHNPSDKPRTILEYALDEFGVSDNMCIFKVDLPLCLIK